MPLRLTRGVLRDALFLLSFGGLKSVVGVSSSPARCRCRSNPNLELFCEYFHLLIGVWVPSPCCYMGR